METEGIHHVGLAVSKLEETTRFFTDALGYKEVTRVPDYPAVFVSDGHVMITLWQADSGAAAFNRKTSTGLHHLAIKVASAEALDAFHNRLQSYPGVTIEFAPQPLGDTPLKHMMCYEPSGIRIELIHAP